MGDSAPGRPADEIERLRQALDAETRRCLDLRRELDEARAGFEHFVSMAAHNLRDPLRDVASYSQLLAEACAGRLDSDGNKFLERIQVGAVTMQSVLTDIVDYWAAGTGGAQSSRIDMDAVLRQVLNLTETQITERGAIVTHDPLPAVMGDFDILTRVLHHLIRNAIEYGGTPSPRVHISSRRVHPEWVLSVKDNGPGIDPAFQGRLFAVFKRLHGREYPGNGLGLAFCKKAIESQGGRLWLESALGAGIDILFHRGSG